MQGLAFWRNELINARKMRNNKAFLREHPEYYKIMTEAEVYALVMVAELEMELLGRLEE